LSDSQGATRTGGTPDWLLLLPYIEARGTDGRGAFESVATVVRSKAGSIPVENALVLVEC
jgi:hypothetical protein